MATIVTTEAAGKKKLTVTAEQIENAVKTAHEHTNSDILDKFTEENGTLKYDGSDVGSSTNYDDTQIKSDIANKQDITDNSLNTTDKTIPGSINEVNGNLLDTIGFSADYKNIILNRKNGLNPYIIPISAIINNAKLIELNDVDSTDIGDGKTLVYDLASGKHKYVATSGTDELVKMDSTGDAKYLNNLIDKSTIVNENGVLKVKKLDGQEVTITELNYLRGLTMNVMDLVNLFANGGIKIINIPVNTYADLLDYDKTGLIDGISYLVYVLTDETHENAKTTYLIDKNTTPTYFGFAGEHRDFTTNPIDLANEITGKLDNSHIDIDALWELLSINDTYKTLTVNNELFGTHGAKALYDELVQSIGTKANTTDLNTHTSDTDIHVTTTEKEKWNTVDNKIDKTSIIDTYSASATNEQLFGAKVIFSELAKGFNGAIRQGLTIENNDMNNLTAVGQYETVWNTGIYSNFPPIKKGATRMRIKVEQLSPNCYRQEVEFQAGAVSQGLWYRFYVDNAWSVWKKISTSTVEDAGRTRLNYSVVDNYKSADDTKNWYEVKNGICYFQLCTTVVAPSGGIQAITGMPPPRNSDTYYCNSYSNPTSSYLSINIGSAGVVYFTGGTTNSNYMYTGSYIIAE